MEKLKPFLEVRDIVKTFNGVTALDGVSFTVSDTETLVLVGPNGAGKSTVVNILSGLYPPDRGSVLFEGKEIVGMRMDQIAQMGIIRTFQKTRLFNELSVVDNLLMGATARFRGARCGIRDEAEYWLEKLNLQDVRNVSARLLPYGRKRLLEIGRAMMAKPRLLLLDEPGAGMSVEEQERLIELLRKIMATGVVLLLIEHKAHIIFSLATQVVVLHHGRKVYEGDPADMAMHPEVQRAYYGGLSSNVSVSSRPLGGV